ncbi:hypothetical protein SBA4_20032 [Candidatus Sulfopaludibacter sp. SbA4]|nr:hypothetical protein SBA4_20032 [Candidatus Sulfopaludibacter sp. SbA4]
MHRFCEQSGADLARSYELHSPSYRDEDSIAMWPTCPQCDGQDLRIFPYDYGTCSQTGYRDAGVRWQCRTCGAVGDAEELDAQRVGRQTEHRKR